MDLVADDYRLLQMSFQACAAALHFSQVGRDHRPILDGATTRDQDVLRSLVRLCVLHPLSDQVRLSLAISQTKN